MSLLKKMHLAELECFKGVVVYLQKNSGGIERPSGFYSYFAKQSSIFVAV